MSYVKSPLELGLTTDSQGIYIESNKPRIEAMMSTGFLEFGVGDTRVDAEFSTIESRMRGHESSKNLGWQHYLLDSIPNPGYRDYALHKEVRQTFAAQLQDPKTGKRNEVFRVAVEQFLIDEFIKSKDFEPIRQWLNAKIRICAAKLNPYHIKQSASLRNVQKLVIKKVLDVLKQNGLATNFVCELAARIGKTILFLTLSKEMKEEFGHESMFIMAYGVGLSVKTSYKDECAKYIDFASMCFIDAADIDAEEQYTQAMVDDKMPVVFISLNPEVEAKYEWINKLAGTHIALLEETDFGTHTDSQIEKVNYILENKTVTRINASGTNIGRLAKAFGKNAIDEIISVPYCMVEQDSSIPNVVVRRFYNMLFSGRINKLLEDFDKDLLPNLTKILAKPYSQQKFISALFQDIFGYQPLYGFNISDQAGEEIKHSMLFVNISKLAMEQLAEVIEKACFEHKVLILNGDYTDNKEAEGLTKEELVRLQNGYYEGRDKLLVITNMMGTRSYSIPEIQACLFMQEGGDVYPYMQKYSRCLTPGFGKKFGHIFDFAFDQSKTRNSVMSVAVEAALLIRQKGKTYPEAVREVMNSVNIKDMISGQWMDADTIIKAFEDNNKLLEIANAHTRITIEDLTSEEIEAFGELAKRSSGSKAEKSKIDKIVETGKTFEANNSASGKAKKDPLKAVVEKAIRMINGSATTVLALTNYQGESFLECMDIIEDDPKMYKEFIELYGVGPDTINRLSHRLEISTLDMIVRMSKYNTTQRHIENNALAILKDDPKLWTEIFLNRELKRFIKSKSCKQILVAAGGHGSEIDVLVDMFGIEIIDKIVYNDKYNFFCNQIKRKYPNLVVVQGDFTKLEFKMKFDVIVGNPPYQDSSKTEKGGTTLWSVFVKKSVTELVNNGGYVVMVTPNAWMTFGKSGKPLQGYQLHTVFTDIAKYFKVGSTFSAWILEKTPTYKETNFIDEKYNLDLRKCDSLPVGRPMQGISIVEKVNSWKGKFLQPQLEKSLKGSWSERQEKFLGIDANLVETDKYKYKLFHTNSLTYFVSDKPTNYDKPKIIVSVTSPYPKLYVDPIGCAPGDLRTYILVDDKEHGENVLSYLNTKLFRFVWRKPGMISWKSMELPLLDNKKWTDIELYALFNLTEEEIEIVEKYAL